MGSTNVRVTSKLTVALPGIGPTVLYTDWLGLEVAEIHAAPGSFGRATASSEKAGIQSKRKIETDQNLIFKKVEVSPE